MKKVLTVVVILMIIFVAVMIGTSTWWSELREKPLEKETYSIVVYTDGVIDETVVDESVYEAIDENHVPGIVLEKLGFKVHDDQTNDMVSIANKSISLRYDNQNGTVKLYEENYDTTSFINVVGDQILFPREHLDNVIDLKIVESPETKTLYYQDNYSDYSVGTIVDKDTKVYLEPSADSGFLHKTSKGERVIVADHSDEWYQVITNGGLVGYMERDGISKVDKYASTVKKHDPGIQYDKKINLVWEAVYSRNPNVENIPDMEGVNVLAPTWYGLTDSSGKYSARPSRSYIDWAEENDYELWALVDNAFDPDLTRAFLYDTKARSNFISNILAEYKKYGFQGINIDFENIYKDDKDMLVQFVAELTAAFNNSGIVVSMDVTVPDGSDNWSRCYDRVELGKLVDYMVVMTYDEHWASSPKSGSVASYNWVDANMAKMTEMVPSEKLLLGIPLYMRIWYETPSRTVANKMDVKSKAVSMPTAQKFIDERELELIWDEDARQHYAVTIEDGQLIKIWIEDGKSIGEKMGLVDKHELAGVGAWRRGYETEDIWYIIDEGLN